MTSLAQLRGSTMSLPLLLEEETAAQVGYEARRKRTEWPDSVRMDPEVMALDEQNGEWILCRTCAENYERTRRGRRPNDPNGFKVKMNGRFQEAAWIMHKSRVSAHKCPSSQYSRDDALLEPPMVPNSRLKRRKTTNDDSENDSDNPQQQHLSEEQGTEDVDQGSTESFFMDEMKFDDEQSIQVMHLPRMGWRCPGIVPDVFYKKHGMLVHAFAKYYVGSYQINVVRDIRSDKVMLFSHECENKVVHRERPSQPQCCENCYSTWLHNKSFKRILKKMDRYNHVEEILRHSWSISNEELGVLSKFKHCSSANLNIEGRRLKAAAMAVLKRFQSIKAVVGEKKATSGSTQQQHQHSLSTDAMLNLQPLVPVTTLDDVVEDTNDQLDIRQRSGNELTHNHSKTEVASSEDDAEV